MASREQSAPDAFPNKRVSSWEEVEARLSTLSPGEFVALARTGYFDLGEHLYDVAEDDPARAADLMTAFADSPLPDDRTFLSNIWLARLTRTSHDIGLSLWARLMSDEDIEVRTDAERLLSDILDKHSDAREDGYREEGFYMVEALHEAPLIADYGLTRQDAYDLYLSYAYAENGVYFDLGRVALAKINDTSRRSSDRDPGTV